MTPTIDPALYRRLFAELAAIGAGPSGWNRLAWGPLEDDARSWFLASASSLGLEVEQDGAGNLWAIEPDAGSEPLVCAGSHVDTVLDGGAFDGALGVVAALVAVEAVRRARPRPAAPARGRLHGRRGGARASTPRSSAAACCAASSRSIALLARVDRDGLTLRELAGARGVTRESLAAAPAWLERVGLWLEVHIEQGVALVDVPAALGVASGLAPRERWRATFEGSANHAGTTPMAGRRDALVAAARTIVAAEALAACRARGRCARSVASRRIPARAT